MVVVEETRRERDPHPAARPCPQVIFNLVAVASEVAGVMAVETGRDAVLDQPRRVVERVQVAIKRRDSEHLDHPALEGLIGAAELDRAHATAVLVRADHSGEYDPVAPAKL